MMIIVFSQPCTKSNNNSPCLYSEKAFQSVVLRLREEMCFVDAGLATARISMQDEPTGVPINRATSFENKVGAMDLVAGESLIKKKILDRFFMDLVAGESLIKERASARFNDLVGSTDVVAGEPLLLIPRRFRQKRAWMELNKIWRTNIKVKGLFFEKVKRGYSVAIAGFITFLPFRPRRKRKIGNPRFTIKSIKPKKKKILVFIHGGRWARQSKGPSLQICLCFTYSAFCRFFFYSSKLITCPEEFWTSLLGPLALSFIVSFTLSLLFLFLIKKGKGSSLLSIYRGGKEAFLWISLSIFTTAAILLILEIEAMPITLFATSLEELGTRGGHIFAMDGEAGPSRDQPAPSQPGLRPAPAQPLDPPAPLQPPRYLLDQEGERGALLKKLHRDFAIAFRRHCEIRMPDFQRKLMEQGPFDETALWIMQELEIDLTLPNEDLRDYIHRLDTDVETFKDLFNEYRPPRK